MKDKELERQLRRLEKGKNQNAADCLSLDTRAMAAEKRLDSIEARLARAEGGLARAELASQEVMTIDQAAQFLQAKQGFIYRLIKEGLLPRCRVNRRFVRILKADLLKFLQQYRT